MLRQDRFQSDGGATDELPLPEDDHGQKMTPLFIQRAGTFNIFGADPDPSATTEELFYHSLDSPLKNVNLQHKPTA